MCWNETVSLNTFLFSLFGLLFAYFNNVINSYLFVHLLSFNSMQLLEYFTWKHLNNKKINRLLSMLGLFLIFIQPILFIISSYNVEKEIKTVMITLYVVFSMFCVYNFPIDFSMTKARNGHLAWNWLQFPTPIIFIWAAFAFGLLIYRKQYIRFTMHLMLFLAIYYTYYTTHTWGSLWCWISNLIAVQLIAQVFFKFEAPNLLLFKNK